MPEANDKIAVAIDKLNSQQALPPGLVAAHRAILLMVCDQCAMPRNLAGGNFEQCGKGDVKARSMVAGVQAGCFPQLYSTLVTNVPDFVITL